MPADSCAVNCVYAKQRSPMCSPIGGMPADWQTEIETTLWRLPDIGCSRRDDLHHDDCLHMCVTVEPTKLNPRCFMSLLNASDSVAGICSMAFQRSLLLRFSVSKFARTIRCEAMMVRPRSLAAIESGVLGNSATRHEKPGV
jgi:hypothetical protein